MAMRHMHCVANSAAKAHIFQKNLFLLQCVSMVSTTILGLYDPISSLSHLLTAIMGIIGIFFLLVRGRGNSARLTSLITFSFSLVFLFSMSGVYHLLQPDTVARAVLQRLDHAGIWVLIAGTFTPIHVILFRGPWRWAILTFVWIIAITGLVLEVVFFKSIPETLTLSLYLGLGWVGALSGLHFVRTYRDRSVKLLIGGGLFYSIGAIIDFARAPILIAGYLGPHEIFHFFVIAGAVSHWFFIYGWSHHPVANTLTVNVQILPNSVFRATVVGESFKFEAQSLQELKSMIKKSISAKYHKSIEPTIRLRYFEEEYI